MGAQLRRQYMSADIFQQTPHCDDVADVRNVMKRDRFRSENRGRHAGQGRVLCAADRDAAFNGPAAANVKLVHEGKIKEKLLWGKASLSVPLCIVRVSVVNSFANYFHPKGPDSTESSQSDLEMLARHAL